MTTNNTAAEITRQRLALQLTGALINPDDACRAALQLEPHLEPPNLLEFVAPPTGKPVASLLRPPEQPAPGETPTALYRVLPNLSMINLPHEWLLPFLSWGNRHRRWQQFQRCKKMIERAGDRAPKMDNLPVRDGVTAGLLLYQTNPSAGTPLRRQLLALAAGHAIGAFLASESHFFPEEVPALTTALQAHSRLLHHVSQYPQFLSQCVSKAKGDHSLWGGLILARNPETAEALIYWLERMAAAACYIPAAAVAALVLQPNAPENQQALWRATLQHSSAARWAFEAVWWSRHTRIPESWERVRNELRSYATSDRGMGWKNWALLDDAWVYQDYLTTPAEPLWAMEYLHQRYESRQPTDDRPLRDQMVERLVQNHGDPMATVVLRFLDTLKTGKDGR
jgi:hypothetical protein